MKQQLESKAVEAVNLLDELDQSNEVPEQLQRIRGQDNFQQRKFPSVRCYLMTTNIMKGYFF